MSDFLKQISGGVIARVHRNMQALFAPEAIEQLFPGTPAPYVSLDLETEEPEPLHVFTWGTAREFDVKRNLTGGYFNVGFHVRVSLIATASSPEEASRIANNYQAIAFQMTLADPTLGGEVHELMVPQAEESVAWADYDGKRHAGYLLDYEARVLVVASEKVRSILEGIDNE